MSLFQRTSFGLDLSYRILALSPLPSLVLVRGKKAAKKQPKKSKKDLQREAMKDYLKRLELRKQAEIATIKVARRGEPLDPEMLNPARKRTIIELSEEEKEKQVLLMKEWARYKMEKHKRELQLLQGVMKSRERALRALRKESLPLYYQSLELRKDLLPFRRVGPTTTPPKDGYVPPQSAD